MIISAHKNNLFWPKLRMHTLDALNSRCIRHVIAPGAHWRSGEVTLESAGLVPMTHYILSNYLTSRSQTAERNCP